MINSGDPGPAPWDLPPVVKAPPASRGRGAAKSKTKPVRRGTYRPPARQVRMGLEDCPGCGFLTLFGEVEGWGSRRLDIWVVPPAEAIILDRYHLDLGLLWRDIGSKGMRGVMATWYPTLNGEKNQGALLPHRCGNKWWLYRGMNVEAVQNAHYRD